VDETHYFGADEIDALVRGSEWQRAQGNQWFIKFAPRTLAA
jgi:hypothetical protein